MLLTCNKYLLCQLQSYTVRPDTLHLLALPRHTPLLLPVPISGSLCPLPPPHPLWYRGGASVRYV